MRIGKEIGRIYILKQKYKSKVDTRMHVNVFLVYKELLQISKTNKLIEN